MYRILHWESKCQSHKSTNEMFPSLLRRTWHQTKNVLLQNTSYKLTIFDSRLFLNPRQKVHEVLNFPMDMTFAQYLPQLLFCGYGGPTFWQTKEQFFFILIPCSQCMSRTRRCIRLYIFQWIRLPSNISNNWFSVVTENPNFGRQNKNSFFFIFISYSQCISRATRRIWFKHSSFPKFIAHVQKNIYTEGSLRKTNFICEVFLRQHFF